MVPVPRFPLLPCLLLILAIAGCAPKTTVVLLADRDGRTGKVAVASQAGRVELDQAAQGTTVAGSNAAPTAPEIWSQERIDATFASTLAALPSASEHFLLYFDKGTAQLTADSQALMAKIEQSINTRNSVDIMVIGHSDTAGNAEYNLRLSRERALAVARLLVARGVPENHLAATSHGENNPLIATGDDVDEPRNRRVEVVIK